MDTTLKQKYCNAWIKKHFTGCAANMYFTVDIQNIVRWEWMMAPKCLILNVRYTLSNCSHPSYPLLHINTTNCDCKISTAALHVMCSTAKKTMYIPTFLWQIANWWLNCDVFFTTNSSQNPFQHSDVLSETWPQEFTIFISTEPVHMENLWHLSTEHLFHYISSYRV